ncbi:MAG: hypothetical protein ACOCZE_07165 [Planctomycetota bacterium]
MSPPDNTIRSLRPVSLPKALTVTRQHDRDDNSQDREKQQKKKDQQPPHASLDGPELADLIQDDIDEANDDQPPSNLNLLA